MNQGTLSGDDLREFTTERETTVTWSPGEKVARLYTNVAKHLRAFRADDAYTETHTFPADSEKGIVEAAQFEIRRDLFDPARGRRRPRVMSDEARKAAGDRLAAVRARNVG